MGIFSSKITRLWNKWELKALVLASLVIQILLIATAGIRKHRASRKIRLLIWSCYLLADWVAILALGVLMKHATGCFQDEQSPGRQKDALTKLWAPFLLLHLGGPDNITAFALEDNELWLRHLLGLLFQVGTAFYIFFSSLLEANRLLLVMTVLMFMAGIIKYVERTLALMNVSRDHFRKSMVTDPDPGEDYASLMEEYSHRSNAGQRPQFAVLPGALMSCTINLRPIEELDEDGQIFYEILLICIAYDAFQKLKRLIVDLVLNFVDRMHCRSIMEIPWKEAYKVIEIELGFLYEVLYTKASVIYSLKGWILRFTSVSFIIAASIIFFGFIEMQQYDDWIDVTITYILQSGAIALELWSLTRLIFTEWTLVWMKNKKINPRLTRFVFKGLSYRRRRRRRSASPTRGSSRLSNSMAQYNLIEFCLKDMQPLPFWGNKVMKLVYVKDLFDNHWYRTYKNISEELKKFILEDLKLKVQGLEDGDSKSYQQFRNCRGELAINKIDTDEVLENSIKAEFDESILLWHIATDICYYRDGGDGEKQLCPGDDETVLLVRSYQSISRDISNYMLYLLVSRPDMLTAGIGQIRFGDTCADAKRFFLPRVMETNNGKQACTRLDEINTELIAPVLVKGNTSQSVLFEAVRVAKSLSKQEPDVKKRWEVISLVWLEMLCYAATHCRGYYHAQRLAAGGELLTLVYFLMAHLGIGEQYHVNRGLIGATVQLG